MVFGVIDAPLTAPRHFQLRSRPTSDRVNAVLVAFTVVRLGLIPPIIATFMVHPNVTAACLSLFMVADLYDGVLARRFDADGPGRRALDSVTDRVAIDACLVGAWAAGAMPGFVLVGLLVRDLYCGALCAWMLNRYRVAIKADLLYRGLSFLIGVWALAAPFVTQSVRSGFAIVLLGLAVVVAVDLTRGVRRIVRSPQDLSGQTIPAGVLRSQRSRHGSLRTASQLQARAT
jgi:phosphatidylglycerophosphate synthase